MIGVYDDTTLLVVTVTATFFSNTKILKKQIRGKKKRKIRLSQSLDARAVSSEMSQVQTEKYQNVW